VAGLFQKFQFFFEFRARKALMFFDEGPVAIPAAERLTVIFSIPLFPRRLGVKNF